jgi:REP element-mobilizing transposase RayT
MPSKFDPQKHHRKSIRVPGYDYSQSGAYFVTIVTYQRECLFGEVVDGEMFLNKNGQIVEYAWNDLPNHYPHVDLGTYIIMPNHFHGIIFLLDTVGAGLRPAPTSQQKRHGLPEIVRALKSFSARRINEHLNSPGVPVWQRNFYDHIIRDDDLNRIHLYIQDNPLNWATDDENPMRHTS